MQRLKTLSVLTGLLAVLAISATPASAWFKSTTSTGTAKIIVSGEFNYAGQGKIKCPASEIKASWAIQTAGQIKEHQVNGKQELATVGPHLNLVVANWGPNCVAEIGTTKIAAGEISVKACELQLVQEKGSFVATGGVVTPCLVKIGKGVKPLCEIQVPAGMETSAESGKGINVGLSKGTLENKGANIFGKVNAESGGTGQLAGEGIYAQSVGTNALCTLKKVTEEAKLTGVEGELEGVKAE
ncbi:MAG TPA: hypothetical protein VIC06_14210 [Solirubrobacteraceae bacterium]|jgi:hypothetical protein